MLGAVSCSRGRQEEEEEEEGLEERDGPLVKSMYINTFADAGTAANQCSPAQIAILMVNKPPSLPSLLKQRLVLTQADAKQCPTWFPPKQRGCYPAGPVFGPRSFWLLVSFRLTDPVVGTFHDSIFCTSFEYSSGEEEIDNRHGNV